MPPWPFDDPVATVAVILLIVGGIEWLTNKLTREATK